MHAKPKTRSSSTLHRHLSLATLVTAMLSLSLFGKTLPRILRLLHLLALGHMASRGRPQLRTFAIVKGRNKRGLTSLCNFRQMRAASLLSDSQNRCLHTPELGTGAKKIPHWKSLLQRTFFWFAFGKLQGLGHHHHPVSSAITYSVSTSTKLHLRAASTPRTSTIRTVNSQIYITCERAKADDIRPTREAVPPTATSKELTIHHCSYISPTQDVEEAIKSILDSIQRDQFEQSLSHVSRDGW